MKQTLKDAYNALTWKNCVSFAVTAVILIGIMSTFGYVTARRFVNPSLIIAVAYVGWKISRLINQDGLSKIIHAAAVGLAVFGLATYIAGVVDSAVFGNVGHAQFFVNTMMWMWVTFHLLRALRILQKMSPDGRKLITESTAVIVAQMTYEAQLGKQALADYDQVRKLMLKVA